ncbi:hypothetical protein ACFL27_23005 [candidate division CSSED10-310 bacterium]|uniref:Uncharacterized protein n=1 Tax=candidate division CSSED10-310 bacterium TaxID=2855610 RepID=A0ABV6Z3Q9_UNCC1
MNIMNAEIESKIQQTVITPAGLKHIDTIRVSLIEILDELYRAIPARRRT